MEDEILHHAAQIAAPDPAALPPVEDNPAFRADYIQFLIDCVPNLSLAGLKIVADCANGASAAVAPELFRRLNGANSVILLNIAPTAATSTPTAAHSTPPPSRQKSSLAMPKSASPSTATPTAAC